MKSRAPALHDVAALAGVSHQTVSRVLNNHPHVAPTTRARVQQAITELGYRRNMTARTLVTGESNVIGVIAPNSILYGPSAMVDGLAKAARAVEMTLTVDHLADFDEPTVQSAVDRLLGQGVAGLLVILPVDSAAKIVANSVPSGVPIVTVDGPPDEEAASVSVDQYAGGVMATEHLLARGHQTVWHVAGPSNWNDSRAREAGWRKALADAGKEEPPVLRGDWSPRSGYEAGRVLGRISDCTAVFAANDHMALGIVRALEEMGRRIPEDVALVGFDDVPESEFFTPPLTTIHQDFAAVGVASLDLLLGQRDSEPAGERTILIAPRIVERASTGVGRHQLS